MRLKLTVLLLAVLQRTAPAQASVQHPPSTASSRRSAVGGGLSLINGKTLVDTRVSDTSGWCHISLVQPLFSGIILLHMTLNGRGSRVVVREIIDTLTLAMRQHGCEDVVCVVNMSEARGASPFVLPCVAGFVVSHRRRFSRISVVEARGLANSATKTVIALSRGSKIKTYRTWAAMWNTRPVWPASQNLSTNRPRLPEAARGCPRLPEAARGWRPLW